MTATMIDSVYSEAARDLAEGRETAATRKVRFEARAAILHGSSLESVKKTLVKKGFPETLASGIVAGEFSKAQLELERSKKASNRESGWSQLGASMLGLLILGRIYPLLAADSSLRTWFALGAVGAVIGIAHAVYKMISGR